MTGAAIQGMDKIWIIREEVVGILSKAKYQNLLLKHCACPGGYYRTTGLPNWKTNHFMYLGENCV